MYYGIQTKQALENFPFAIHMVHKKLIYAIVMIKKSAALANEKAGKLSTAKMQSIIKACDEILKGKYDDQFVTPALQGGAGTSINMNVNEVIASLSKTHPNDDVNMSQSTNDVNPAALKITCIHLTVELLEKSTAYATLLTPVLGYDVVSKAVKETIEKEKTIREVILEKKLMTEKEFDKIANV